MFNGPFDLLLHLILREEVDIHEVSLSRIVDAYLVEIERMQALDLDIAEAPEVLAWQAAQSLNPPSPADARPSPPAFP